MSVSLTQTSQSFSTGGGVTTFSITAFTFLDADELLVVRNTAGVPTTLLKDTDYTVSGGNNNTGSITTPSAISAGSTLIVTRVTKKTQLTSYTTGDRFPATTHERALDKLTMLVQEATTIPGTATASGTAPYVLQASTAGATPAWVPQSSGGIAAGAITNTMLAGSITPGKLSTGGPVWDTSGNLTATSFVGNASTATFAARLTTPRTIALSGDVTGTASFDGSANATIAATVPNNSVTAAKLGSTERLQLCKAFVNFNGVFTNYTSQSYTRSGTTVTVTTTSHGLATDNRIYIPTATDSGVIGFYAVTVLNANSFSFQTSATGANGTLTWYMVFRSSYNVSSVTKNGGGDYTVNFATPMADANYSVSGSAAFYDATVDYNAPILSVRRPSAANPIRVGSVQVQTNVPTQLVGFDCGLVCVQIFGN
jgi:hypothetical protein